MHKTGDYVADGGDFSLSKWLTTTNMYLDKIQNDLTGDNWTSIFRSLHCLQEDHVRNEQVEIGASLVPKQREALLPADPPSPPLLDQASILF